MKNSTTEYRNKFNILVAVRSRDLGFDYGKLIGQQNYNNYHDLKSEIELIENADELTPVQIWTNYSDKHTLFDLSLDSGFYEGELFEEVTELDRKLTSRFAKFPSLKNRPQYSKEVLNKLETEFLALEKMLDEKFQILIESVDWQEHFDVYNYFGTVSCKHDCDYCIFKFKCKYFSGCRRLDHCAKCDERESCEESEFEPYNHCVNTSGCHDCPEISECTLIWFDINDTNLNTFKSDEYA